MSAAPFSAAARREHWEALGSETFDVLIIGGGVTGSGIARDAAGRGLKVVLVEAGDIGGGTSSRSSRLVHGGLRYLETFDFGLVFEALRERRRLLELAPHLVEPLPFLFPVFKGDPTGLAKMTAGMWLYESLSLFRSPKRHRIMGRNSLLELEPKLRSHGLAGGAMYYDAQVDDARLTLAVARAAAEAGARIISHAAVEAVAPQVGQAGTATIRDTQGDGSATVKARVIVNATGPWSDYVRALADSAVKPRLRTTKGVHILVDRDRVENRNAIIFRSVVDGRVMFVLPWGEFTYIGTTDTEYSGRPEDVAADQADIDYLLRSANEIFPSARLGNEDVLSTWAGVRPLLAPEGAGLTESQTSREHEIWQDDSGLLNIAGGKLTTYRSMAAEVAGAICSILKNDFDVRSGPYYTEFIPLPGAPDRQGDDIEARIWTRAQRLGLSRPTSEHLVARYGSEANLVVDLVERDPALGELIVEGLPYLLAEVVHSVRAELALTLEDVLRRRTQVFYEAADGGLSAVGRVAGLMAREEGIGWSASKVDAEISQYGERVSKTRPHRQVNRPTRRTAR